MKKKKWFALCISSVFLILSLISFVSCTEPTVNEEEFLTAARDTLSRAAVVNQIWFTEAGIPAKENGFKNNNYQEIDNESLQNMGFQSLDAAKEETQQLFDSGTYDYMMKRVFEPSYFSDIGAVKRYIVHKTIPENEGEAVKETVMRYTDPKNDFFYESDVVSFDVNSLKIEAIETKNGKQTVTTSVNVTVTNEDGKQEYRPAEAFDFVCEDGKWKLCETICITYSGIE